MSEFWWLNYDPIVDQGLRSRIVPGCLANRSRTKTGILGKREGNVILLDP